MSSSAKALLQGLNDHKASDVLEDMLRHTTDELPKSVVELDSHMTTLQAAEMLWKYNILSAPVWDSEAEEYVGFFDMRDILSAVVASTAHAKTAATTTTDTSILEHYNISMAKELENMEDGTEDGTDAVKVTYLAKRNPMHASRCTPDTSLHEIAKLLAEHKCHRVPLCDPTTSRVSHIISQSALVKFLSRTTDLEESSSETLVDSGLYYKKDVVTIKETAPAWEAFGILDAKSLSGIAVVDEDTGALVANTSARDIRLAASVGGSICMTMDVMSYLAELRMTTPSIKDRHPTCSVHETDTIAHVLHLLAKTGYHRLFVVDEEKKPIGVVSVADIIRFALEKGAE